MIEATARFLHWQGWRIASVAAVMLLLLGPALWNGYPLVYFDSEDYVEMAFSWQPIIFRIMTYGLVTVLARPFDTLWVIPVFQALLMAWMLHEAVWAWIARYRPHVYLAMGLLLSLATGLPWVVAQVMADMFAGLTILGVAVLAFGSALPRWRRAVLIPVVGLSICVHMTHVAVASGLVLVLAAMWLASRFSLRMPRPRLVFVLPAVALGVGLVPATHWMATGKGFFSASGQVLQLALFVQDGLAQKYLDEVCPGGAPLKLCEYKEQLPHTADEFLWGPSVFQQLGGWTGMQDEAAAIVKGTIKTFPMDTAKAMVGNTLTQMELIGTGEDLVPMSWHFVKTQLRRYPDDFRAFRYAMQQRHGGIDFELLNQIQVPIAQAAQLAALVLLAVAWKRRDRISTGLLAVVIVAFLGNAFVCGALSNPHDRYQNRIVWLALFAVSIAAIRLDQRFTAKRPASAGERRPVVDYPEQQNQPQKQDRPGAGHRQ
ncbi:protein of unknown function [Magnetospirillum gryphiswaldense MSR-1 v2]|uniref:Transmembrane protein n=1 Tax=Magnetospirillum gryphiswaldense (strain DSM 6361 / JCM 21280 / NBRC 15271 / MSR-1) TaxID=431944 RepID=V6EX54_MAGGM|nr:hypothetical protein [Magnetospirillum gryphiswaldense]CDK97707.1 protein of unknown function [Magnetospirillum gryphiswaldense MSR-1 v2]